MKILQICSYYTTNKLYKNLFIEQEKLGIENKIFVPIGNKDLINKNYFGIKNGELIYEKCFNSLDKFNFLKKQKKIYEKLKQKIDLEEIEIVHAHTLFTNGKLAYNLKNEFNKKYIVAVRNTDINMFFRYFIWLRKIGVDILLKAEKIVLITPTYIEKLMRYIPKEHQLKIKDKIMITPNGMENFWFENKPNFKNKIDKRLLFVGRLDKNKRILDIIKAVIEMNNQEDKFELHIVGDGPLKDKVIEYSKINKNIIYLGKISDLKKLKKEYEEANVFIMPSKTETFGIVYLEALSQGCKVIHTKGEGIDGYELLNAYSIKKEEKLTEKIAKVSLKKINENNLNSLFHWNIISKKYKKEYINLIIKEN